MIMKRLVSALAGLCLTSTVFAATPTDGGYKRTFSNCTHSTPVCAVIVPTALDNKNKELNGGFTQVVYPGKTISIKYKNYAVGAVTTATACETGSCQCTHKVIIPNSLLKCISSPTESEVVEARDVAQGHGQGYGSKLLLRCSWY